MHACSAFIFVPVMELMKVKARILRDVGKEIGTAWQKVCGCLVESLDLDMTMEDEMKMGDTIGKFSVLS